MKHSDKNIQDDLEYKKLLLDTLNFIDQRINRYTEEKNMSQASGIEKCLNYLTNQIDLKHHDQQKSQQKIQQIESELTKRKAQYDKLNRIGAYKAKSSV